MVEVLAEGRFDAVHVYGARPGGSDRGPDRPSHGAAGARQLAHRARGVRRSSLGVCRARAEGGPGTLAVLPAVRARSSLQARPATSRSSASASSGGAIGRWGRGVDTSRFDPALRDPDSYPGEIKVLYAGRLTREKGVDLLADAFIRAHEADPRLHLLLAGGGPEEEALRDRLGGRATFLGWLGGDAAAACIRQRRRLPLLQPDRHLRPGPDRGGGERSAVGAGSGRGAPLPS